jgi:hypothetical protein
MSSEFIFKSTKSSPFIFVPRRSVQTFPERRANTLVSFEGGQKEMSCEDVCRPGMDIKSNRRALPANYTAEYLDPPLL